MGAGPGEDPGKEALGKKKNQQKRKDVSSPRSRGFSPYLATQRMRTRRRTAATEESVHGRRWVHTRRQFVPLLFLLRAPLRNPSTCNPPSAQHIGQDPLKKCTTIYLQKPHIGRDPFSPSRSSLGHQQVGESFQSQDFIAFFQSTSMRRYQSLSLSSASIRTDSSRTRITRSPTTRSFLKSFELTQKSLPPVAKPSCECSCP